jgi:hypothetical protein
MSDEDCAIDYLLKTWVHINPALTIGKSPNAHHIKSSYMVFEGFNSFNADRFLTPPPATATEMAELKHYLNFFKLVI